MIYNILYFCFWKDTLRNTNRCEYNVHFFVFSVNAFEKPTFDDGKTVKIWVFMFFINFPSLKNRLLEISSHELTRDFQNHSEDLEIWKKKSKIEKKCFSNLGRTSVAKTMLFQVVFTFFFALQVLRVLNFSVHLWWPLLSSFQMARQGHSSPFKAYAWHGKFRI